MGKDTWKQITKCTATLSTILSLRHNLLFALSDANNACLRADKDTSNNSSDDFRELIEAIYKIQSIIKYNENLDVYDGNIAIKDITEYIKHLVRDAQQSKAKSYAFDKIDNNSALRLHDFSQKIIPIKYCESQKEYFGKKGKTLHIDVFCYKLNDSIQKKVYMTAATRSDQGMSEILGIADIVLGEFKKEHPYAINIYGKSDNAGSYHGNFGAETLYKICQSKGVNLVRYDYNEPCCGKDQCNRESAVAKNLIHSFVDAGNDVIFANDIFKALQFANLIRLSQY